MAFWNKNKEDKENKDKKYRRGRGAIVDVPDELKELLDQHAEEFRRIEEKEKMENIKKDKMADSMFSVLLAVLNHNELTEDKKDQLFIEYLKKFSKNGNIEQSCTMFKKLFDHKYPVYDTLTDADKQNFDLIINQMSKFFAMNEDDVRELRNSENPSEIAYGDDLRILKGVNPEKSNEEFVAWMENVSRVFDKEFGPASK